jgi:hypothetical protein
VSRSSVPTRPGSISPSPAAAKPAFSSTATRDRSARPGRGAGDAVRPPARSGSKVCDALIDKVPDVFDAPLAAGAEIGTVAELPGVKVSLQCRRVNFERELGRAAQLQPGGHVPSRPRRRASGGRRAGDRASGRARRLTQSLPCCTRGREHGFAYVSRQYQLLPGSDPGPTNARSGSPPATPARDVPMNWDTAWGARGAAAIVALTTDDIPGRLARADRSESHHQRDGPQPDPRRPVGPPQDLLGRIGLRPPDGRRSLAAAVALRQPPSVSGTSPPAACPPRAGRPRTTTPILRRQESCASEPAPPGPHLT